MRSILTSAPTVLLTTIRAVSGFTSNPSSLNITAGELASFDCQHPDAAQIVWRLNGTLLEGANFPPTIISTNSSNLLDGSGFQHSLTIRDVLRYNNTSFDCVLPDLQAISTSALLRVQGLLDAPGDVRSTRDYNITNMFTITWSPPFSLDLTNIDPYVIYCLEVYNITCGEETLVISDCNVTELNYHSNVFHPGYIYNITIIPRSNVEGALNGTPSHTDALLGMVPECDILMSKTGRLSYGGTRCIIGVALAALILVIAAVMLFSLCLSIIFRGGSNRPPLADNETTSVEMNRCAAYEVPTLARQKVTMEANPAYEQVIPVPQ